MTDEFEVKDGEEIPEGFHEELEEGAIVEPLVEDPIDAIKDPFVEEESEIDPDAQEFFDIFAKEYDER